MSRVLKIVKQRRDRGFSLVEAVIAASILAIVLLVFLSMMFSSGQLSASSRESTVAASIIQSTSEDLFSMSYPVFWQTYFGNTTNGIFSKIVDGGDWKNSAEYEPNHKDKSDLAKGYWFAFSQTGRLKDETIWLVMLPSSDVASDLKDWSSHAWVDFKLIVRWTDPRGKEREEYIITRRSQ